MSRGYQCEEAGTGDEALNKIRSKPVALMILDIKMPGKSGIELLTEIKADHPDIAVIMATALAEIDTAIHCMKQGAYDYITKPFNLEEVVLNIERALENRDYQEHLKQKVEKQAYKIRDSFLNAITALADAYDAITSERPYRDAMSIQSACHEIERCKGSQFDPEAADTSLRIKKYSKLDKICQHAKDR